MGQHVANDHCGWCEREKRWCLSWGQRSPLGYDFLPLADINGDEGQFRWGVLYTAAQQNISAFTAAMTPPESAWWAQQPPNAQVAVYEGVRNHR